MCAAHASIGLGILVLYNVMTLYFETDEVDDFRKPGFPKGRRLEPQITVGLLSDVQGFPPVDGRLRRQHGRDEEDAADNPPFSDIIRR